MKARGSSIRRHGLSQSEIKHFIESRGKLKFWKWRNFTKISFMETTIRINTDMLTMDIMEGIKKMFPHKTIDIIIQPSDETEYILSNHAYAKELEERIAAYETKKETISVKASDLL